MRPKVFPKLSKNFRDLGKSEGGGRNVSLTFNKQTNSSIEAFWVNFEGKLKSYGTISSGVTLNRRVNWKKIKQ